MKWALAFLLIAALAVVATPAEAYHRSYHYGWPYGPHGLFGPHWSPYVLPFGPYYGYPYTAPYAVVPQPQVVIQPPTTYTQQQPAQQFWYYCTKPPGFYPYVSECAVPWLEVVPQTTPPQR